MAGGTTDSPPSHLCNAIVKKVICLQDCFINGSLVVWGGERLSGGGLEERGMALKSTCQNPIPFLPDIVPEAP